MTKRPVRNLAASVRQRLLNLARARQQDFQVVLTHYAIERMLYRISQSRHRDQFILKGAMLFHVWGGIPPRVTRDMDLLGQGAREPDVIAGVFRELVSIEAEPPDGVSFDSASVEVQEIRDRAEQRGVRIRLSARLEAARMIVQVDIGFGDVVTPAPTVAEYPTLLDLPAPTVRIYPPDTVVAEKLEAMVKLGVATTRMKDLHDIWVLSRRFSFEGGVLSQAVRATFERRRTAFPARRPEVLSPAFFDDSAKQAQWAGFLSRSRVVEGRSLGLPDVVSAVGDFVHPVQSEGFRGTWPPGGPWQEGTNA